ncbi:ubiquinone anaerobic biosynthesis accessory factor UbiT [Simplicispira psychrophila]|uniref:ubiquinone anaerobic biosynthesis accessory factor UbiT n=1 Tax=Simplicispira psychrophila TaxID=80882 RepID=UPI00068D1EE1|nr:SCP2 sterol-binding domain-containing protein [Simplicispira psychrophila]
MHSPVSTVSSHASTASVPLFPTTVPAPVAALLSRLPAFPGSALLTTALNVSIARQLPSDVGALLLNKRLRIRVTDARVTFDFTWTGGAFAPRARHAEIDLCISASAHDFLRLAQRQEDPDTLFFNRRLSMEGDTELGLVVKNTLDALELPVLDLQQWAPRQVLARLAALRPGGFPGARP